MPAPLEADPVPGPEEDPPAAGAAQPEEHQLGLRPHRGLQRGPGRALAGLLRQVGHLQGHRRAVRRAPADDQLGLGQPLRASVSTVYLSFVENNAFKENLKFEMALYVTHTL